MSQKAIKITGWVLTILLALLFTKSAFMKFTQTGTEIIAYGMSATTFMYVGFIELFCLILFIIPRTGVLGTLLLVAYMGGVIVTHLEHHEPIVIAVIIQIILWITAFIRFPEFTQRLLPKN